MIKTAVVSGFSGFIGTTFTMQLLKRGWKVYGIDKFTHVSNNKLVKQKHENFSFENTDIRQIKWLPECDVIFNFAAESDVDIGNQSCDRFIKSNIDGVRNLLDISVIKTQKSMKTLKFDSVIKQLKEGKIECVTDLKIGYVEIRNCENNKRKTIQVI